MGRACIIVTTDFSEDSLLALAPAASLAHRLDADLVVLHVVPDLRSIPHGSPLAPLQSEPDLSELERDAKRRMEALRERLPAGLDVSFAITTGEDVGETINAYAAERGANMLVMASHGKTGVRRMLLGSVAQAALRKAVVPILVVPADPQRATLRLAGAP